MNNIPLEEIPLLENLSKQDLNFVADFLIDKQYQNGDSLFARKAIRDKAIIITNGLASINSDVNPEQTVALFKAYDSLGELSLVIKNSQHKYDTVVASPTLNSLELSVYNWHTIVKKKPAVSQQIIKNIAKIFDDRLSHANNKLVSLFRTGKTIASYNDLDKITEEIIDAILKIIPSQKAALISLEKDAGKVHVHQAIGYKDIASSTYYNLNEDILLSQLSDKPQTVFINKHQCPNKYKKLPYITKTLIIVPLTSLNEVIGFIILGDKINGRNFSINNQILLETVASQIAPAIKEIINSRFKTAQADIKKVYIDPFAKL